MLARNRKTRLGALWGGGFLPFGRWSRHNSCRREPSRQRSLFPRKYQDHVTSKCNRRAATNRSFHEATYPQMQTSALLEGLADIHWPEVTSLEDVISCPIKQSIPGRGKAGEGGLTCLTPTAKLLTFPLTHHTLASQHILGGKRT